MHQRLQLSLGKERKGGARMVGGERGAARAVAQVTVKRVAGWEKMSALTYVREEAVKTPRFLCWCVYFGFPVHFI